MDDELKEEMELAALAVFGDYWRRYGGVKGLMESGMARATAWRWQARYVEAFGCRPDGSPRRAW